MHPNRHHFVFTEPDFHIDVKITGSDRQKFSFTSELGDNTNGPISI